MASLTTDKDIGKQRICYDIEEFTGWHQGIQSLLSCNIVIVTTQMQENDQTYVSINLASVTSPSPSLRLMELMVTPKMLVALWSTRFALTAGFD